VAVYGDGDVRRCVYERQRETERDEDEDGSILAERERELEEGSGEFVSRLRLLVCLLLKGDLSYFCACTAYRTYSSGDLASLCFYPGVEARRVGNI
jgi:hypothetical protein